MIPVIRKYLLDIIEREGGFVDHPNDKGGPTKFGITKGTYENWRGRFASVDEVKNLTKEEAYAIYLREYFIKPRIDLLPPELWAQILDCSVNHGPIRAVKLLQQTCNKRLDSKLVPDGIVGPKTRREAAAFVNCFGSKIANNLLAGQRIEYYQQIVQNNPSQEVFLNGWLKRAKSFMV